MTGAISGGGADGGLVCVDLGGEWARELADEFLPKTGMIEGRPGKPRSHRYFVVKNVPPQMRSDAAGNMGGPRTRHLKDAKTGKVTIDFLGTGAVSVVPPSAHPSGEAREWDSDGPPAELDFMPLWEEVLKLHVAAGGRLPEAEKPHDAGENATSGMASTAGDSPPVAEGNAVAWLSRVPMEDRVQQCRAYLETVDPAISGQGGHDNTWRAVRLTAVDFAVTDWDEAWKLLVWFNEQKCEPKWTEKELRHKLADALSKPPSGGRLKGSKLHDPQAIPESSGDPHRLARTFLSSNTYRYFRREWWFYTGTHYVSEEEADVRAKLTRHIKGEFDRAYPQQLAAAKAEHDKAVAKARTADQQPPEFRPPTSYWVTNKLVGDAMQALKSEAHVDPGFEMPAMLPGGEKRPVIAFKNGLFDHEKRELLRHTPAWFSPVCLPYDYDPKAPCREWVLSLAFSQEGDRERIKLLQEFAGYALFGGTVEHKMLLLYGAGNNGKSVFLAGVEAMLGGRQNVSHVPLEEFGSQFRLYETLGKLANICSEVGDLERVDENRLKQYVSGDPMSFNRKGLRPVEASPTARLLFSANKPPRFNDSTNGMWRRLFLVPFRVTVPKEKEVKGMDSPGWWLKSGEAPGIFHWALAGWGRYRKNGGFTRAEVCEQAIESHRMFCNPAKAFLVENVEYVAGGEDVLVLSKDLYARYRVWCGENGHRALAANKFGEEVGRAFPEWYEETRRRKKGKADEQRLTDKSTVGEKREQVYLGLRLIDHRAPPEQK
jgi:P4 family phage/plasmid primase-like protien